MVAWYEDGSTIYCPALLTYVIYSPNMVPPSEGCPVNPEISLHLNFLPSTFLWLTDRLNFPAAELWPTVTTSAAPYVDSNHSLRKSFCFTHPVSHSDAWRSTHGKLYYNNGTFIRIVLVGNLWSERVILWCNFVTLFPAPNSGTITSASTITVGGKVLGVS